MANLQCNVGPQPLDIQDTQANLRGSGDNIPVNRFLRIDVADTLGGPYTDWLGPNTPGTNIVGQTIQNIFGCIGSPPQLLPSTTYYYVTREIDTDGVTILDTSSECTFTTLAASEYMSCGPGQIPVSRNTVFSTLNDGTSAPCDGSLVTKEFSTSALGPWTLADDLDFNAAGPCTTFPNPQVFVNSSTNIGATQLPNGLVHNTPYFIRYVLQKNNGDPDEIQVCGPITTNDYAEFSCTAAQNIDSNSADLPFTFGPLGQGGGSPDVNAQPGCNDDNFTVRYGTTPGGPYPNTAGPFNASAVGVAPTIGLTGLTPNTTYYYILEVAEMQETGGVYETTVECNFTTTNAPNAVCTGVSDQTNTSGSFDGIVTGDGSAGLTWETRYGTTNGGPYPNVPCSANPIPANSNPIAADCAVAGLTPSTTYYYVIVIRDALNNIVDTSNQCQFTTFPDPQANCFAATNVDSNSAELNGGFLVPAPSGQYRFRYGTTPGGPYPTTVGPFPTTGGAESANTGNVLLPGTTYYFVAEVLDNLNNVLDTSGECSFVTLTQSNITDPATNITDNSADLNGRAFNTDPGDTTEFIWGTTPGGPYPNTSCAGTPTGPVNPDVATCSIGGLSQGTQYCYRIVTRNALNVVVATGNEQCFTTLTLPPIVDPCEPATNITPFSATLNATSQNVPAGYSYQFRYGTTPGGPYPFTVSGGPSSGGTPDSYSANIVGLTPGTTYYYTSEVLNPALQVVAGGGECTFDSTGAIGPGGFVTWCGTWYDSAQCEQVDIAGDGTWDWESGDYWYCGPD